MRILFILIMCMASLSTLHGQPSEMYNDSAKHYFFKGQYKVSLIFAQKCLFAIEKEKGTNNSDYAHALKNIGSIYDELGLYKEAMQSYRNALKLQEHLVGKKHKEYAEVLNSIAVLMISIGNYEQALPLLNQALKIREESSGKGHPDYANTLINLAYIYTNQGYYEKALPLNQQALHIIERTLGKQDAEYVNCLNNLADLYSKMGRYQLALPLFVDALKLRKVITGPLHPDYALNLNNLGIFYITIKMYNKALPLFQEALTINEKILGVNHIKYAANLNNIANLYEKMHLDNQAIPLYKKSLLIYEKAFGKNHILYISNLNYLALSYSNLKRYQEALPLLHQAVVISESTLGNAHPDYANSVNNLGSLYANMNNYALATDYIKKGLASSFKHYKLVASGFSELQREFLLNSIQSTTSKLISLQLLIAPQQDSIIYSSVIKLNNIVLEQSSNMQRSIETSRDTSIKRIYNEWKSSKQLLAVAYTLPSNEQYNIKALEANVEKIEDNLNRRSIAFNQIKINNQISFSQVRKNLLANNAAIEFFQFNYWNKRWTDTTYYAVCVIRPEWKVPQYFILGDQRSFQRLMSQQQNSLKALYQQVWQPIDKLLQGVQQVFYAPTGLLHRLTFDALPNSEGKSLFDRYTLHRLNSTKQIGSGINTLSSNTKLEHNWTAVLLGGIDYKTKYTDRKDYRISTVENQAKLPSTRDIDKKQRSISAKGIDSLPGTRAEVRYIASLLTPFLKTRILTDTNASEWAIKRLSNQSPDLLVIATHGYYFADPNSRQSSILNDDTPFYTNAENPLLRSGLLLAGSEPAFTYDIEPRFGQEDGILTAYELADLNLDNTKLCVLSACESGLGDIRSTEGVYGLQRALKIAGVKKVILSLWKVSDRATYELMKLMYTEWKSGKTLHESLTNAQKNVRQSNPLVKDWAGFVLIE